MTLRKRWKRWFRKKVRNVKLVDQYVLAIMVVLLAQSVLVLFLNLEPDDVGKHIDAVLHTTMASIFGYLVSTNFVSAKSLPPAANAQAQKNKKASIQRENLSDMQVRVAGCLCLFSVLMLVLIRYFIHNDYMSGYISLYRDFVSGCVGFLIGIPSEKKL